MIVVYKFRPGIASFLEVKVGADTYDVIYMNDPPKPLEAYRNDNMRVSVLEELPLVIRSAAADWFARVFAEPIENRGAFIATHGPLLPELQVQI